MSQMHPYSATDLQIGSDWCWKSSKTAEVFQKKKKSCILYQFRADVQTYSHWPWYTAKDAADTEVCTQKCHVTAASTIREMRSSSESTSHCHLQQSLDWMVQANALASQVTGPHTNGLLSMGPHWRPDIHVASWCWRGSQCPFCCSSNLTYLSAHISLRCVVSCVSRSVAIHLNVFSKLVQNKTFFQNTSVVLLDFKPLSGPIWQSIVLQRCISNI